MMHNEILAALIELLNPRYLYTDDMKSGLYYEYFCYRCGWFPSREVTNPELDYTVRKRLEIEVKEHEERCRVKPKE